MNPSECNAGSPLAASGTAPARPFGANKPGPFARFAWWLATTPRLARPKRKWFRKRLANRFPGPFDIVADRVKLRAWPSENRCDRIAVGQCRLPEAAERRLILPLLKPGMVFVDVGANVGVYSLFVAAETGGSARILALEPHPRTYSKLVCNIRCNGHSNLTALNIAAGPGKGSAVLYSDGGGNIGGSSLIAAASGTAKCQAIETDTLPEILTSNGIERIDLLKADVEGFEDQALMPLFQKDSLRYLWPHAILIEIVHQNLWKDDLMKVLRECGYEISMRTEENLLLTRR